MPPVLGLLCWEGVWRSPSELPIQWMLLQTTVGIASEAGTCTARRAQWSEPSGKTLECSIWLWTWDCFDKLLIRTSSQQLPSPPMLRLTALYHTHSAFPTLPGPVPCHRTVQICLCSRSLELLLSQKHRKPISLWNFHF